MASFSISGVSYSITTQGQLMMSGPTRRAYMLKQLSLTIFYLFTFCLCTFVYNFLPLCTFCLCSTFCVMKTQIFWCLVEVTVTVIWLCYGATHSKPVCRHSAAATCLQSRSPTCQNHQGSLVRMLVKPRCDSVIVLKDICNSYIISESNIFF